MRNIQIITLILLTLININVLSQSTDNNKSYKLLSLENNEYTVNVKSDIINDRIIIELNSREKFCINGYRGFEQKVNVLNKKFLELHFKIRGGTGVAFRRYTLICISDGKLYKAIDVLSMVSSEFNKTYVPSVDSLKLYDENRLYKLNFSMLLGDNHKYILIAMQTEKVNSKYDPKENHDTKDTLQFNFDINNKVFYNELSNLKGSFLIDSDDGRSTYKKDFNNEVWPAIKLKNEEYYFINQSWYIKDGKNHLSEFSCSCK